MGRLAESILASVRDGLYVVGEHAVERLEDRGILEWQVVEGLASCRTALERPRSLPCPSAEFVHPLADGTLVKSVWSLLQPGGYAKLVTVHFLDG